MKKRIYPIEVLSVYGQEFSKKEQAIIKKAHCVFGAKNLLTQYFADFESSEHADKIFNAIASPLSEIFLLIAKYQNQGKRVLVFADGDALYFGIGASLLRHFGPKKLKIYAGISIVQKLCAAVKTPWHDVKHVSLHGRSEQKYWQNLNIAVFSGKTICVLTDEKATPQIIAKHLLRRGAKNFTMYVGENLGLAGEKVSTFSLAKAAKYDVKKQSYCTILLVPVKSCPRPVLGLMSGKISREKNLITKSSVRAAALSLLGIMPSDTVWDIGAGSGSVALEACALAYAGQVIAVEKNVARIKHIEKNRKAFGAVILDIYQGDACEIVSALPKPNAIFVGGGLSASNAEDMLQNIYKALAPDGRMVISCVLLGTLHRVEKFFKQNEIPTQVMQITVNNSTPLGKDIRLVPENPVFLVSVVKAES